MRQAVFTLDVEHCYPGGAEGAYRYLDVLRELNVPATFFVAGNVATSHPGIVEAILKHGHEVGSHGFDHPSIADAPARDLPHLTDLSPAALEDELARSHEALRRLGAEPLGFRAVAFRVNQGVIDAIGRHFAYDSSLPAGRPSPFRLGPLRELPVATLRGTGQPLGTTLLYAPGLGPFTRHAHALAVGDPLVLYGHSFDLVRPTAPLHVSRLKRLLYFDRCGPERVRELRNVVAGAIAAGWRFVTGAQALGLAGTRAPAG
jgi:hypothetical protein